MNIASRMKNIREVLGMDLTEVADSMHISSKAFTYMEQGYGNPRLDTLSRFCDALHVDLNFLLAMDVPVTQETVSKYAAKGYSEFITDSKKIALA
jgi:transcriptional regulator with XRE-family HTH domain